jgi:PBP1b-binding outer membrane lipoprotein LpoB
MEHQMETHRSRLVVIAAAALLLGGCMSTAEIAASDESACRNAGTKPGTPAYAKCLDNRKEQRRVAQIEGDRAAQRMTWGMQQSAQRSFMSR